MRALILVLVPVLCFSQIRLPKLISSGMVLQRSEPVKIWGWAMAGEHVEISFNSKTSNVNADKLGNWSITIPAQKAGGPFKMVLKASNTIVLDDILFGDVWLCSGQSNMELPMSRLMDHYPQEAKANNTKIRQFVVPDTANFKKEQSDVNSGKWVNVNPKSIAEFSGVGYFFASDLYARHGIPIGIINSAVGGSPAQAWLSEKALKNFPEYLEENRKAKDDSFLSAIENSNKEEGKFWYAALNSSDDGLKQGWYREDYDDSQWDSTSLPASFSNMPISQGNGAVWFRKTIELSEKWANLPAKLVLGRIVDADSVFVNGKFAGTTSYQYPPRKYPLASGILKPGRNIIAVRVISNLGIGGFVLDKHYCLVVGTDSISLKGQWKIKKGSSMRPMTSQVFVRNKAGGLYNAMIAPLQNYVLKGVLWYQGESNTQKPDEYFDLMQSLVKDWRKAWGKDLPFLYVQLPGFMSEKKTPEDSNWAILREQQRKLKSVANTAMVVAIDLGEWNDIHPLNKRDVSRRLALQAEHLVYGNDKVIATGPVPENIRTDKNKIVITFSNTADGLKLKKSTTLCYFAIAACDEKYVWAAAQITGRNEVTITNDFINDPAFITYAWADNPATANLYNSEDLPAGPFKEVLRKCK
ncbi:MAG: sialate O-acetylesterase [Flavobacterium sp.]|nr:sialate O-acetylesterase [Flavobacterium sp.]